MAALASGVVVFLIMRRLERNKERADEDAAQNVLARARSEAEEIVRRSQQESENARREMELELKEKTLKEQEAFEAEKRTTYKEMLDKERALSHLEKFLLFRDETMNLVTS